MNTERISICRFRGNLLALGWRRPSSLNADVPSLVRPVTAPLELNVRYSKGESL